MGKELKTILEESQSIELRKVERRYDAGVLLVPPVVKLDGDKLVWRFPSASSDATVRKALRTSPQQSAFEGRWRAGEVLPSKGELLTRFVKLAGENVRPDRFRAFAQEYGPLGICDLHRLPFGHPRVPPHESECKLLGWDGRGGWEPLSSWCHYARRAEALLFLGWKLRSDGKKVPPEKLKPLSIDMGKALLVADRLHLKGEPTDVCAPDLWTVVVNAVNEWIQLAGVRPQLRFLGQEQLRPRLVLAPAVRAPEPQFSLFGALGMQLAFAVSGARGFAFCAARADPECPGWYEPGRQPRIGEDNYCTHCGKNAAWNAAQERKRKGLSRPRRPRAGAAARPRGRTHHPQ